MDPNLNPQLGRRSLLKLGLGASLALSTVGLTASLTGCTSEHAAPQFKVLRESDLPLLAALYPAIIGPHPAFAESSDAIAKASAQLDWTLERTSPFVQKSILDLLGLLSMPVTRGPLTGVWGDMAKARSDGCALVGSANPSTNRSTAPKASAPSAAAISLIVCAISAPEGFGIRFNLRRRARPPLAQPAHSRCVRPDHKRHGGTATIL